MIHKHTSGKRLATILLTLSMLMSVLPGAASAAQTAEEAQDDPVAASTKNTGSEASAAVMTENTVADTADGTFANGQYTAILQVLHETKNQLSMIDPLFAHAVEMTIDGDQATVKLFVANPVPAFPEQSADGTVKDLTVHCGDKTYPAVSDLETKPQKKFEVDSLLFGIKDGEKYSAQVFAVVLPKAEIKESATFRATGYVNVVMNDSLYFRIRLSSIRALLYTVDVHEGEIVGGKTEFTEGETVTIKARSAPYGKVFDCWVSESGVTFGDATAEETTFTMPGKEVAVTATYRDAREAQNISYGTEAIEKTYGDLSFTNPLTESVVVSDVFYSSSNTDVATVDARTGAVTIKGAGASAITATAVETATHAEATARYILTVDAKPVVAKPTSFTIKSNESFPTLTWAVEGLVSGDTLTAANADEVKMEIRKDGVKQDKVEVGTYQIVFTAAPDFGTVKNYTITNGEGTLTVERYVAPTPEPDYGGSSGGGSSRPDPKPTPKPETEVNPDGSTTETVTRPDGTKVETTENKNGDKTVVETRKDGTEIKTETTKAGDKAVTETKPDGSSQTEVKQANGTKAELSVDKTGRTEAEVEVSKKAVEEAAEQNKPVALPLPPVEASRNPAAAPVVEIEMPGSAKAPVTIPVAKPSAGTVAVIVHEDGTEEVIRKSAIGEDGLTVSVQGKATVKIVDNSKSFADIAPSFWAGDSIDFVTSRELFNGTSQESFTPNAPMTRGQLMTVLARLEGADTSKNPIQKGMEWAKEMGISDGTNPKGTMSRQQLATMLWRLAGSPELDTALMAPDASQVADYAQMAMSWAVENGIMGGYADGTLNPQGTASRAHVAAMVQRYVNK